MSRLTLPQLSAFLELAETSSFRDAADQLGVSQPALSRTIQQIERRVGARLFDRDTRKVTLTRAGERLRLPAARLLENYEILFREFNEFVEGRQDIIRIAALPSIASVFLPTAIQSFQKRYPNVTFEIWEDVGDPVHYAVRDKTADLGLAPPPNSVNGLRYQELFKDRVVFVCRADDQLADQSEHRWTVFGERPFISMSAETGLRRMVENGLAQSGILIDRLFNCKQPSTAAGLVAAGRGLTALTRLTMGQFGPSSLVWRPLMDPEIIRSIGIVRHIERSLSPATQAFVRELERLAREMRAKGYLFSPSM